MGDVDWERGALTLFLELMHTGPPPAFRESAEKAVRMEAERNARSRRSDTVEIEDVAGACLRVAPPVFRPNVIQNLSGRGIVVGPYVVESTTDREAS